MSNYNKLTQDKLDAMMKDFKLVDYPPASIDNPRIMLFAGHLIKNDGTGVYIEGKKDIWYEIDAEVLSKEQKIILL